MDHIFEDEELTPAERHALASLASDRTYLRGLEDRTVATLRKEGLLRGRTPAWVQALRWTAAAAAMLLAFFGGTEFQKHRAGDAPSFVVPVGTDFEQGQAVAVTFHLDLDDPFEESFSDADAHPKVRISRALALQTH